MADTSEGELDRLIRQLDADLTDDAMSAQAELTELGRRRDVVEPLSRRLPSLQTSGQLCAIEIFEELADPRAGEPLITLLGSENSTVREWAAGALGRLDTRQAVPAIRRAYQASLARHDPPDCTEPVALRWALTDLQARQPVTPPLTGRLQVSAPNGWTAWPSTQLVDVIDDLSNHNQVVLYFQLWRAEPDGHMYNMPVRCGVIELDFGQPWPALVDQAHTRATVMAQHADVAENVLASIEWIDESDLAVASASQDA